MVIQWNVLWDVWHGEEICKCEYRGICNGLYIQYGMGELRIYCIHISLHVYRTMVLGVRGKSVGYRTSMTRYTHV